VARIRTIKPEFWTHEDLSELPEATHMLAAALLNHADDEGYFNANPGLVKAACSPLREPSVSIQDSLKSLSEVGYLKVGTGQDGKRYGWIVKFDDHQRVNRPTPSKIKAVGIVWEGSPQTHTQLSEPSPPEGKGKEQGKEGKDAPRKRVAVTFRSWVESLGDQPPIPNDDPVHAYAAKVGIPGDYIALAWDWFDETYTGQRSAKRYADWRQVFRNAVESNWPKLWFIADDGRYGLTTVGKQRLRSLEQPA
jgi:hypothetical protein